MESLRTMSAKMRKTARKKKDQYNEIKRKFVLWVGKHIEL